MPAAVWLPAGASRSDVAAAGWVRGAARRGVAAVGPAAAASRIVRGALSLVAVIGPVRLSGPVKRTMTAVAITKEPSHEQREVHSERRCGLPNDGRGVRQHHRWA